MYIVAIGCVYVGRVYRNLQGFGLIERGLADSQPPKPCTDTQ